MTVIIHDDFNDMALAEDIGGRTPSPTTNGNIWLHSLADEVEGDGAGRLIFNAGLGFAMIDAGLTDVKLSVVFNPGGGDNEIALYVRAQNAQLNDPGRDYYQLNIQRSASPNQVFLFRVVDGVATQLLAQPATIALNTDATWRIEIQNTTIRIFQDDVQIGGDVADAAVDGVTVGGTFVRLRQFAIADATARMDEVLVEDFQQGPSGGASALIGGGLIA